MSASCRLQALGNATRNSGPGERNERATTPPTGRPDPAMTGNELRMQLRMQQQRNQPVARDATSPDCAATRCNASATDEPVANDDRARRWGVRYRGVAPMEVLFSLPAAQAEVSAIYPGARVEPLPEPIGRQATQSEAAELQALIAIVTADWPQDEQADALAAALADPDAALVCFRTLASNLQSLARSERDYRRACQQCDNLSPGGPVRGRAAW